MKQLLVLSALLLAGATAWAAGEQTTAQTQVSTVTIHYQIEPQEDYGSTVDYTDYAGQRITQNLRTITNTIQVMDGTRIDIRLLVVPTRSGTYSVSGMGIDYSGPFEEGNPVTDSFTTDEVQGRGEIYITF